MNYQPLFDLMSQHGLTLLEGEMDEIIRAVNEGQGTPTDTKKCDPALYWVMGNHIRLQRALQVVDNIDTVVDAVRTSLNLDKPDEVESPCVIPKHTIPIERIEEIIISTAPAPAKLNQITNLIEKYKAK